MCDNVGIRDIYNKLLERLPSSYPRPILIIHKSIEELRKEFWRGEIKKNKKLIDSEPFCFCDASPNKFSINIPPILTKSPPQESLWYILHEIGHLYYFNKEGENSTKWADEKISELYADRFANRWMRRLKKEGFFK